MVLLILQTSIFQQNSKNQRVSNFLIRKVRTPFLYLKSWIPMSGVVSIGISFEKCAEPRTYKIPSINLTVTWSSGPGTSATNIISFSPFMRSYTQFLVSASFGVYCGVAFSTVIFFSTLTQ